MRWISSLNASVKVAIYENICRPIINSCRLSGPPFLFFFVFLSAVLGIQKDDDSTIEALYARLSFPSSLVCSALAHLSMLMKKKERSQVLHYVILTSLMISVEFFRFLPWEEQ